MPKALRLVLASQSPRRKELISYLGVPFTIVSPNIEEISTVKAPGGFVEDLAVQKLSASCSQVMKMPGMSNVMVVAADTTVCLRGEKLGKPQDTSEAREMLKTLAGQTHEVFTGVALAIYREGKEKIAHQFHEKTLVHFRPWDETSYESYLETGDSLDKAGAYGIQGQGLSFIQWIEGPYSNVVGLPIDKLIWEIKGLINEGALKGEFEDWGELLEKG